MNYVKISMLVIAEALLGFAIFRAIQQDNYLVVGALGLPFLVIAYLGYGVKLKSFKSQGIEVETNAKDQN